MPNHPRAVADSAPPPKKKPLNGAALTQDAMFICHREPRYVWHFANPTHLRTLRKTPFLLELPEIGARQSAEQCEGLLFAARSEFGSSNHIHTTVWMTRGPAGPKPDRTRVNVTFLAASRCPCEKYSAHRRSAVPSSRESVNAARNVPLKANDAAERSSPISNYSRTTILRREPMPSICTMASSPG